ncbi:trypsin-like serine protease [Streptomyces sp. NBC_00059]|uniref:trypsin-like serine protease n=1 Tax=Streptomyces sp. NBC_00059 TaxID=2975635 RepID=UPI00224E76EC|nr:trypsin-like serine protease [Streptomyces sp. NBC_00059]MCX5416621.1 trypsin-like serine protease [Streptomyces sp. NBC_00059]
MRISRHAGSIRNFRRLIGAGVAALALLGSGLAVNAQAAEGGEQFLPPKGATVVSPAGKSSRIIGGTSTAFSSAPWMVQILFEYDNDGLFYFTCGGTLVAPNKVMTAAHCVTDENGKALNMTGQGLVLAGTAKLAGGPNDEGTAVGITRSYFAGSYNAAEIDNDIALLTLSKPLSYTPAQPASYGDNARYTAGTVATTYGWGMTGSDWDFSPLSDTLLRLEQPLRSDAECSENLDTAVNTPGAYKAGHMICAGVGGTGNDSTGKATCPGDSGSPMFVSGRVIGITSWGPASQTEACNMAGTYDAYTKVATYYRSIQPRIDDTSFSGDHRADLFARTTGSTAYTANSTGEALAARKAFAGSYSAYNLIIQTDLNRDGYEDLIARQSSTGDVYWLHRSASSSTYAKTKMFSGWKTVRAIVAPGDVNNDGKGDVLAVTSTGDLMVYPSYGNGKFNTAVKAATGYQVYNQVRGHGDFTYDGKNDLLLRRGGTNDLYLAKGTGKSTAPFETPVKVRSNWSAYDLLVTPGDVNGDAKSDLVARTPAGALYLLKGTGVGTSEIFATQVKLGTGWNSYYTIG